jgi:hypothetical protein
MGWKTVRIREEQWGRIVAVLDVEAVGSGGGRSVSAWLEEAVEAALRGPVPAEPVIRGSRDPGVVRRVEEAVRASGRPDAAAFQAMSARQALLRRRPPSSAD